MGAQAPKFFFPDSQLLRGDNYVAWKPKIKVLLEFEDLWTVVDGQTTRSLDDGRQQVQFDRVNQKAKLIILFIITDDVQPHIRYATSAKDAWDKLSTVYEEKNKNVILNLLSQLHTLKFKHNEQVEVFLRRVATLRESLLALGKEISDEDLVPIVLRALPPPIESL
ncbi:hypothetical protein KI387_024793 [Taxus chinensis]|uniref:DUF4219 domain-containing protein n=1 Tax=Taxus chinensis TaxID=29808 RepID=A0AA38G467_TAXCH|nr:hypothetical protein KI387_024793 [Taxus chinensis]